MCTCALFLPPAALTVCSCAHAAQGGDPLRAGAFEAVCAAATMATRRLSARCSPRPDTSTAKTVVSHAPPPSLRVLATTIFLHVCSGGLRRDACDKCRPEHRISSPVYYQRHQSNSSAPRH
eukprot:6210792-Pleurochrysis_carterae.AAC.2